MSQSLLDQVTVVIPVHRDKADHPWLQQALQSFPVGVKYLIAENDGDIAEAMNEAVKVADTEFVYLFGYDDIATTELLPALLATSADADVVYPTMALVDENLTRRLGDFPAAAFCPYRLERKNFITGSSLIRRSAFLAVGGFRDLETLEDWDLFVRMSRAGYRFQPQPHVFFYYRQVEGSRNRSGKRSEDEYRQDIVGAPRPVRATFYAQLTLGTAYWRCQVPAKHLPAQVSTELLAVRDEDTGHLNYLGHEGAAVFQFPGSHDRAWTIMNMVAGGIRVLVEVDDNYLAHNDVSVQRRAGWKNRIGEGPQSTQGHEFSVREASGVIVTTPTLAEIYGQVNPNVYVCPNSIEPDDWPVYEKPDDGVFRIGWFASASHDKDAHLIRRAMSWASRQPNVEVVTVGYDPPGWNFTRQHVFWSDNLREYRRQLLRLDVGLAPIARTGWSVCRSDLKALEYAFAGALPVLSVLEPYDGWQDRPALMAGDAREFEAHVRWCVKHRDEARELAARAREYVLAERLIQHEIKNWEMAVAG